MLSILSHRCGCGSRLNPQGAAGFSPWFHLPGQPILGKPIYCGWIRNPLAPPKKPWNDSIPLYYTNKRFMVSLGFKLVRNGFRPSAVFLTTAMAFSTRFGGFDASHPRPSSSRPCGAPAKVARRRSSSCSRSRAMSVAVKKDEVASWDVFLERIGRWDVSAPAVSLLSGVSSPHFCFLLLILYKCYVVPGICAKWVLLKTGSQGQPIFVSFVFLFFLVLV